MNVFHQRWFLIFLRVILGGIFVYAGTIKVGNPQAFADSIATFQLLPPQLINLVALGLPVFEILVGGMLVFEICQRQAAFALLGLMIVFVIFLFQAIARGLEIDCGCFGSGQPSAGAAWISLGRNLLLVAACWWVFQSANTPQRERRRSV